MKPSDMEKIIDESFPNHSPIIWYKCNCFGQAKERPGDYCCTIDIYPEGKKWNPTKEATQNG